MNKFYKFFLIYIFIVSCGYKPIFSEKKINFGIKNLIYNNNSKVESTINKSEEIDQLIIKKLKNWDLKRIALIDKLILRLAVTEMLFFEDIPHKVSIVEGVEIAKIYGNNESSRFINGVLDSIYNDFKNNNLEI